MIRSLVLILSIFSVTIFSELSSADRYDDWAREQKSRSTASAVQKLRRHYANAEQRFFVNLDAFRSKFGGFRSQPECRDALAQSGSVQGRRQVCSGTLCVSVIGARGHADEQTDDISYESFRSYEMLESCRVVIGDGRICDVAYIHSPNDGWMTGFGGYCVDASKNSQYLIVPFRNTKFN